MRKLSANCLATTALTLLALAVIASLYHAKFLFVSSVFQSLCVNIVIHAGLYLLRNIESRYFIIDMLWKIGYTLLVPILSGFLFNWYGSTPLWVVILMGIVIYLAACFIDILKINDDLAVINRELKKRESTNMNDIV